MNSKLPHLDRPLLEQFCAPLIEICTDYTRQQRDCPELSDQRFLTLGVLRHVLGPQSGRDFLQQAQETFELWVPRATYFHSLNSRRREGLLAQCSRELFQQSRRRRLQEGLDVFAQIPALANLAAFAVDGHHREHATHSCTDAKGRYVSENALYVRCLRTGLIQALCDVQGHGRHAHEMPAFREALPDWLKGFAEVSAKRPAILVVDPAYIDLSFWTTMKLFARKKGCEVITRLKENMKPLSYGELAFDRQAPENLGVLSDQAVGFDNAMTMRLITYRDPETRALFKFLTSNTTLPPGLIAWLYLQRWSIEKSYDTTKNKLEQRKGWATGPTAQRVQSHFTALSFNLMVLFEQRLKQDHGIEELKVHQKRQKELTRREKQAAQQGKQVHPLVKLKLRWHQQSYQFIRTLRNFILGQKSLREALPRFQIMMAEYL